jgi:mannose-6-phosphate isomerase-like protein (cupin superfamily)
VLLSGKVVFRYGEEEEVVNAGDAYYARPGHTALVAAGTELVEFSPSAPARQAEGVSVRNMVAALSDPDSIATASFEAAARAA